jgi:hypothetical protein
MGERPRRRSASRRGFYFYIGPEGRGRDGKVGRAGPPRAIPRHLAKYRIGHEHRSEQSGEQVDLAHRHWERYLESSLRFAWTPG